jgi:multicomponent Na+:H+ antiporter subunit E
MKLLRIVLRLPGFVALYLWELVRASLRVAHDALTPTHYMRPAILAVPLDAQSDLEILLLANFLTMTPGSVCLDVSADRRVLYVHAMYVDDPEAARREIKTTVERRVIELLR